MRVGVAIADWLSGGVLTRLADEVDLARDATATEIEEGQKVRGELGKSEQRLADAEEMVRKQSQVISNLKTTESELQSQLASNETLLKQAHVETKRFMDAKDAIYDDLRKAQVDLSEMRSALANVEGDRHSLRESIADQSDMIQDLNGKLRARDADIETWQKVRDADVNTIGTLIRQARLIQEGLNKDLAEVKEKIEARTKAASRKRDDRGRFCPAKASTEPEEQTAGQAA